MDGQQQSSQNAVWNSSDVHYNYTDDTSTSLLQLTSSQLSQRQSSLSVVSVESSPSLLQLPFSAQLRRAVDVASHLRSKSHWVSVRLVWLLDLQTVAVTGERLELPNYCTSTSALIIPVVATDTIPCIVLSGLAQPENRKSDELDVLFAFMDTSDQIIFYRISASHVFSAI